MSNPYESPQSPSAGIDYAVTARLAVMMFIQFFLWGSWYVTAPLYLDQIGFTPGGQIMDLLRRSDRRNHQPLLCRHDCRPAIRDGTRAGRDAPVGRCCDVLRRANDARRRPQSDHDQLAILCAHMLCYYPTLALTNSLAMQNIRNSEKEFSSDSRVWHDRLDRRRVDVDGVPMVAVRQVCST